MKALVFGLIVWLAVEAAFSIYYKVWFNVGVDIAVFALFSIPLLKAISHLKKARPEFKSSLSSSNAEARACAAASRRPAAPASIELER